jgi:hypothetical protein
MRKRTIANVGLFFSFCLLSLLSGCCINLGEVFRAKYERTESLSVPINGAAELYVETEVGSITMTGIDGTECDVTAEITVKARTKEKARRLSEQVQIQVEPAGQRLSIRAKKPAALKSRSLSVNFKIATPRQLDLKCTTHVGTIKVSNMNGRIEASADVGSIICKEVVADLELSANVGSINAKYSDTAPSACNADIATNVGSIEFTGPPQLSAELNASTNVGSLKTSQPLTVVGKVGKSVRGTIGSGQGRVHLRTNVGSIEIK